MTNKQKQYQLKLLSYYTGKLDGKFGTKSKKATKAFQKDYNIKVDGKFGPTTITKSKSVLKSYQTKIYRTIKIKLTLNGLAGVKTISVLKTFQKKYKIKTTGTLNSITKTKINFIYMTTYENNIPADYSKFKYFKRKEFSCPKHCSGHPVEMKHQTIVVVERARKYFNSPCTISSGVRCKKYNDLLPNAVINSKHLSGKAIDCSIEGVSGKKLKSYFSKQKEVKYTYIIKDNWVHFNIY